MPTKPTTQTTLDVEVIPADLRQRPQWVVWLWLERDGKWTKPPFQSDGTSADTTDPATWMDFSEALTAYNTGNFDGLGYVTTLDDGIVGVDLDHCRNLETSTIDDWALDIVRRLNSYTEVSPSGTGIRIFLRAKLPPQDRRTGRFECYEAGRYLTVTGNHLEGSPTTIEDRQMAMEEVHAQVFAERRHRRNLQSPPLTARPVNLDDEELLARLFASKNGQAISRLFSGDTGGHGGDHSAADLALCSHLAFWTGGNLERIDRLFRSSDCMRPKWDEPRGAQTYVELTIARALEGMTMFYSPRGHDVTDSLSKDDEGPPFLLGATASF